MIFDDLRFLRRLSLWLLVPLVVVTILLSSAVYWLCATENGARWLLNTVAGGVLKAESIEGNLNSGLSLTEVDIRSKGTLVRIDRLQGRWHLMSALDGQLVIDNLEAFGVDIELSAATEDSAPMAWPSWQLPLPVAVGRLNVNQLSLTSNDLDHRVDHISASFRLNPFKTYIDHLQVKAADVGKLSLSGNLSNRYPYNNRLTLDWEYLQGERTYSGHLKTAGDLKSLNIDHQLSAPFAITSSGELRLPASPTVPAEIETLGYSLNTQWQQPVGVLPNTVPAFGDGSFKIQGTGGSYEIEGNARLVSREMASPVLQQVDKSLITLNAQGDLSSLVFGPLNIVTPWGSATASGSIDWSLGFSWDGRLRLEDLATRVLAPEIDAVVTTDIETSGSITADKKESMIDIKSLSGLIHGRVIEGEAKASLSWQQGLIATIDNAFLRAGNNSARLQGTISNTEGEDTGNRSSSDLSWQIAAHNLAELGANFGGSLESQGTVRDEWPELKISGLASGHNLRFQQYQSRELALSFSTIDDSASTQGTTLGATLNHLATKAELRASGLQIPEIGTLDIAAFASGTAENHSLNLELQQGPTKLATSIDGGFQRGSKQQWQGRIQSLGINSAYSNSWHLEKSTELTLAPQLLTIAPFCLGNNEGKACGQVDYRGEKLTSSLKLERLDLALLRQWLPSESSIAGRLQGELSLKGPIDSLVGNYGLTTEDAEISVQLSEDKTLRQALALSSEGLWQANEIQSSTELALENAGTLSIDATLALPAQKLSGQIYGELDSLAWIEALTDQITHLKGGIDTQLSLGGTINQPRLEGRLNLAGFQARIPATGTDISGGDMVLSFDTERWQLAASASSKGETLSIDGSGQINSGSIALKVAGENFPLINLDDYSARISPDLVVAYKDRTASINGSLLIPEANITIKPKPAGITEVSEDEVVTPAIREPESTIKVKTTIDLALGEKVHFEGYGLSTDLKGELKIKRQARGLPSARGTISLENGTYEAYGQELEVSRGLLLFQGPLDNPGLNIRAQRQTQQALVGVDIGGTANRIESRLFSDPSLPQTHALSLLVTGKLPGNYSQTEGNQVANTAAALGIGQSEWLTTQLQQELGVDVFALQGGDTYLDSAVVVGKYLSPKLYVSYVQKLFSPQGSLAFEYHIDKRLGLKAESGDAQSLDLLYRIEH